MIIKLKWFFNLVLVLASEFIMHFWLILIRAFVAAFTL